MVYLSVPSGVYNGECFERILVVLNSGREITSAETKVCHG